MNEQVITITPISKDLHNELVCNYCTTCTAVKTVSCGDKKTSACGASECLVEAIDYVTGTFDNEDDDSFLKELNEIDGGQ